MKDPESIHAQIEAYLAGEMDDATREAFDRQLAGDAELRAELAVHRELAETMAEGDVRAFSSLLAQADAEWEQDTSPTTPVVKPLWQRYAAVAVAAAAVLLVGIYFLWPSSPLSSEAVFAQHYDMPDMRLTVRSDNPDELLEQAISAYKNGAYASAIEALTALSTAEPDQAAYSFYLGIVYLESKAPTKAIQSFDQLLGQAAPGNPYYPMAEWYRSLAYVSANDIPAARSALEAIAGQAGHFYQEKAKAVLEALRG